jgi:predicted RND superfamily exporter protein
MAEAAEWSLVYASGDSGRTLGAYLNQDGSAVNVWVFLNHADYAGTKTAMDVVRSLARDGPLKSADISFAGDAYLGYALVDEIARSLWLTLSVSLVLVFLVVWVLLRSASRAAVVTLPVTCSVLWNFGFLGWAGIPIGVATSTFSSIALGIGIDFAIQWTARLEALRSHTSDWESAVLACQTSTGSAIVLHSAVMVVGFGLLAASAVPPNRSLGLLVCVNLVVCALVTLCVLPAVGTLWSSATKCFTPA